MREGARSRIDSRYFSSSIPTFRPFGRARWQGSRECEFKTVLEAILRHGVRRLNDSQVDVTARAEFFAQRTAVYTANLHCKNFPFLHHLSSG